MKTYVVVKLQVEGLHNFPNAPEIFPKVGFLAFPHRHIFHIEAKKEVYHDDRDVEFILFKREIQDYLTSKYYDDDTDCLDFGPMSCEMIAKEVLTNFECTSVTVWEDLENGAIVEA